MIGAMKKPTGCYATEQVDWGSMRREKRLELGYFYVIIHCINHVFLFYSFDALTCWGFADTLERLSLARAS